MFASARVRADHASMRMRAPFCSGRCQPRHRWGPVPVCVLSVLQRGTVGHRPQLTVNYFAVDQLWALSASSRPILRLTVYA